MRTYCGLLLLAWVLAVLILVGALVGAVAYGIHIVSDDALLLLRAERAESPLSCAT
jgi:hypothetical protein